MGWKLILLSVTYNMQGSNQTVTAVLKYFDLFLGDTGSRISYYTLNFLKIKDTCRG